MTSTFTQALADHQDLPVDDQKKAGQPVTGTIDEEHTNFLKTLIALIDSGEIKVGDPQSFLKHDVYDGLEEQWKDKTDLALNNISDQVSLIHEYWISKQTPNDSPQLQTMVEQLWQMKQRIEEHHDVFKF